MEISHIMSELFELGIIERDFTEYRKLDGGTSSSVFAVLSHHRPVYVIKINDAKSIEAESYYLTTYAEIELLPHFVYVDNEYRYYVYKYKSGESEYVRRNKKALLTTLVRDFIIRHKPFQTTDLGYGYLDEPVKSWKDFHFSRAFDAKNIIKDKLSDEDHGLIYALINKMKCSNSRYLLHGDCGVHNFLFYNDRLSGVIDPTPVIGERIYDLVYAFCSSPEDLNIHTIERSALELGVSMSELIEEVIKGLYYRVATCMKYHSTHLNDYLEAWKYWKKRVL